MICNMAACDRTDIADVGGFITQDSKIKDLIFGAS